MLRFPVLFANTEVFTARIMIEEAYQLVRPRGIGYAVADFSRACLIRLIDFPELPLRTNTHETIKAGRTALLVRTEFPVGDKLVPAAYKRVRRRNRWKVLTALLRTNRLLRTWRLGRELLKRGIATPRPLAVVVPRAYDVGGEAFLAVEWIGNAQNLREFSESIEQIAPQRRNRPLKQASVSLGRLIGRLHAANIAHRDLKATNLLLRNRGPLGETYVIDLDGASLCRRLPWSRRLRNLSRLEISLAEFSGIGRTARRRFLEAYLDEFPEPRRDWKTLWRELATISSALSARKHHKAA